MGFDWNELDIQVYERNNNAFKTPDAYIGIYNNNENHENSEKN